MKLNYFIMFSLVLLSSESRAQEPKETENSSGDREVIFIGTYTKKEGHVHGKAKGIYRIYRNKETGALELDETVARLTNPSFVKVSPDNKNLYAVSELGENDAPNGFIYSYEINPDHTFILLRNSLAFCHRAARRTTAGT